MTKPMRPDKVISRRLATSQPISFAVVLASRVTDSLKAASTRASVAGGSAITSAS